MVSETTTAGAPKLSVTVGKPELVLPTVPREDHTYFLTNLDQNVAVIVKTVFLFKAQEGLTTDPVAVLKESLAKVLDHYYPLAGRLGISVDMKLQVNYNSQGVVFVGACADANLVDLGDISTPDERLHQLVYTVPEATNLFDTPLVVAQVTKFNCGGFVLGLANQHSMFDGVGANEFVQAWGETARGLPITTPPFIDRTILKARVPPQIDFPHLEFAEIEDLSNGQLAITEDVVHRSFCFTPEEVDVLKKKVTEAGGLTRCTTFELLSGLIWKARTTAMNMVPEQKTRLYFAVDGRRKFVPPLPSGYMGNGIVLTFAMTTYADLSSNPLHHSVKLVQEAIDLIDDKYMKSCVDYFETTHARPGAAGSMIITSWAKLPIHSTNFGWGESWQAGPVVLPDPHIVLFLSHGKGRRSVNIMLGLPSKAMDTFVKVLHELI